MVSVVALAEAQGRLARSLRTAATTDPLTGVANRRAWEDEAARHLARAARTGEPLSFAILDLDHFKEVNDREGHGAGDALLPRPDGGLVGAGCARPTSSAGTAATSSSSACRPPTPHGAREILAAARRHPRLRLVGRRRAARPGDTLTAVLARADADLYLQKRSGRTA